MKTTDLIPLILYQLVDSDKYGYEIVKEIEDASSGIITIKQPTLYSLLKKLEQGKFISSYWQDSEIGGKRHYYKLTDNGKAQLDTYPAYESIIKEICGNSANFESKEDTKVSVSENHVVEPVNINISNIEQDKSPITTTNDNEALIDKDDFSNDEENSVSYDLSVEDEVSIKPIKIDLTSPITPTISEPKIEVEEQPINLPANEEIQPTSQPLINIFDAIQPAEEYVSAIKTEENNSSPVLMHESNDVMQQEIKDEPKPENISTSAPTMLKTNNKLYSKMQPTDMMQTNDNEVEQDITEQAVATPVVEETPYREYTNLSTNEQSVNIKRAITRRIQKMTVTCLTLLAVLVCSLVLVSRYTFSSVYCATIIIAGLVLIFYPIILLRNVSKIRLKYCSLPFKYHILRDLLVKLSIFLIFTIYLLVYNLKADSIGNIFALANCANFIAPLMAASVIMLDFVYSVLFFKKYRK